jgi:colanic acid/amylovoran biosynthesis glycosyltransferase
MRIAYVCNRYPALSNTFIMREVRGLRRQGLEVDVLSVRRPSADHLLAEADREEYRRTSFVLPPSPVELVGAHLRALITRPRRYAATLVTALRLAPPGARGTLWQLFYFAEAGLVWNRCRRRGIRHLHAHFAYVASDVALLASRLGDWSWSFSMHGPPEFYAVESTRLAEKVRDADAVICISDFCRSQLMGLVEPQAWDKLRVVHCGIGVAEFAGDLPSRNGSRGIEVLMVGRVVPVKGHPVLVEAIADLRRRGVEVRATIVGEGPERDDLERMAERMGVGDRIRFTGAVGQDDIRAHYERADVFCLPSFAEGLPVVAMEAMAMGLPVVSTRIMGIPEVVEHGVTGLLVPPARHDLLADALERLAGDPELRAAMGKAGREKVESEFDADDSAAQLREVYGGLI